MLNRKGLSTIVVTLIIVLLSLAAVAIVWAVVSSLIKSNTQGVDLTSKCLNVNVEVTQANCSDGTTNKLCTVQLSRSGLGDEEIGGVKLVFRDGATEVSSPSAIDVSGNIAPLVGKSATKDTGIVNSASVNKVEVTPYFKDISGKEKICSQTSEYSWEN